MPKMTLSIVSLIGANLVPVVGVIGFGWDAATIVLLYWTENVILGGYNVLKMALLMPRNPMEHLGKLFMIPFFSVHFGGFCAVHGFFLIALFGIGGGLHGAHDIFPTAVGPLVFLDLLARVVGRLWGSLSPGMEWAVLGLVGSHGVSLVQNYILGKEYAAASLKDLMVQPYGRIVLLHVTIIAGAAPMIMFGSPVPLLCILIGLKIVVDVWSHVRSHRKLQKGPPAPGPQTPPAESAA